MSTNFTDKLVTIFLQNKKLPHECHHMGQFVGWPIRGVSSVRGTVTGVHAGQQ